MYIQNDAAHCPSTLPCMTDEVEQKGIPAVQTPAGLKVVGGGRLATPGGGTPVENMEAITTMPAHTL